MASRNTYKYHLEVDGKVVLSGMTTDLKRRQQEHLVRWPTGRVVKVGRATTHKAAWYWQKEQEEQRLQRLKSAS